MSGGCLICLMAGPQRLLLRRRPAVERLHWRVSRMHGVARAWPRRVPPAPPWVGRGTAENAAQPHRPCPLGLLETFQGSVIRCSGHEPDIPDAWAAGGPAPSGGVSGAPAAPSVTASPAGGGPGAAADGEGEESLPAFKLLMSSIN